MCSNPFNPTPLKQYANIGEKINARMNAIGAKLAAKKGRGYWMSDTDIDSNEVLSVVTKQEEKNEAENIRVSKLTKDERAKETRAILAEFTGHGFLIGVK